MGKSNLPVGKIIEHWFDSPLRLIGERAAFNLSKIPGDNIIVISTRTPAPGKPMSGGMAPAVKDACEDFDYKFWYGYAKNGTEPLWKKALTAFSNAIIGKTTPIHTHEVEGFRVRNVHAEDEDWDLQYNQFCNRYIWPFCHDLVNYAKKLLPWDIYGNNKANYTMAKRIHEDLGQDDTTPIWIHDYHHLPLAEALREHGVRNPVIYFHHIPLPEPEILEQMSERERLSFTGSLKALRACDGVVFQTEKDAKLFVRYVGEQEPEKIEEYSGVFINSKGRNGRDEGLTYVGHAPISINTQRVKMSARQEINPSDQAALDLDKKLVAKYVIINFERCDFSKGILQRAMAFKELLEENPGLQGELQLVLGIEPTRTDIPEYQEYAKAVREIVEEINSNPAFLVKGQPAVVVHNGHIPNNSIHKLLRNRKPEQRMIGTITSHKDGMNLTSKEFAASQDPKSAGVLVISKGVGAAAQLVNGDQGGIGYDSKLGPDLRTGQEGSDFCRETVNNVKSALKQAINMPQEEANRRAGFMLHQMERTPIQRWANHFKQLFSLIDSGVFYPKPVGGKPQIGATLKP